MLPSVSPQAESAPWRLADREFAVPDDLGRLFSPFRGVRSLVTRILLPQYGLGVNLAYWMMAIAVALRVSCVIGP